MDRAVHAQSLVCAFRATIFHPVFLCNAYMHYRVCCHSLFFDWLGLSCATTCQNGESATLIACCFLSG